MTLLARLTERLRPPQWAPIGLSLRRAKGARATSFPLRARELDLLEHATTGSHTLFMAEITADYPVSAGPRLFHTTSSHLRFRSRRGIPLQGASPDGSPNPLP